MVIYFSMFFLTIILLHYSSIVGCYTIKLSKQGVVLQIQRSNILVALSFLPMLFVSGLRYDVGIDYWSYSWIFTSFIQHEKLEYIESGYGLLNSIVGMFTADYMWILLATSAITLYFVYVAYKHLSTNYVLSLTLYMGLGYFFYSMNSIRHFMALSLYLVAVRYMKKGEFLKYLVVILIASTFHTIAFIAIPLYFILRCRFKTSYYLMIFGVLTGGAVFSSQLKQLIYTFAYSAYKDSKYDVSSFSIFNILLCLIVTLGCIAYYNQLLKRDKSNIVYINAAIFGLMFYLTCFWLPTPTRIGHFFTILFTLAIPAIINCEQNLRVKRFLYYGVFIFTVSFMYIMLLGAYDPLIALLPYNSVFSQRII